MNELQEAIYNALENLTGEEVLRLFTNWHGTQILDDEGFAQFIEDEGYSV